MNTLAFYLASAGQLLKANKRVQRALQHQPRRRTQVALLATRGLLAFRLGNAVQGEKLYLESAAQARTEKDRANELLAQLYLTRERSRVGQVSQRFKELLGEAEAATEPGVILAARKIRREGEMGLCSPLTAGESL